MLCRATELDYALGIGVQVDVIKNEHLIACIKLICSSDNENFEAIKSMSKPDLIKRAFEGFLGKKCGATIDDALKWQSDIKELEFEYVSPIIGNLHECF